MAQENKFIKSLIQSAQNGNSAALEQLFEMNIARIFGLCLRILGNQENAEAVTILVFIEAWKQIKFIRPDISFTEWLCSMAVWNSLELIRSGDNSTKSLKKKKKGESESNNLMLNEFDKEIINLSDKERLPFVLYKIEGYKEDETGDLLSIKPNELKKKIDSASKHIVKNISTINSVEEIPLLIAELTKEIKPTRNLKKIIFDDIYELKIKEIEKNKKPDPKPEPEPEPDVPKKKKEKKPKVKLKKKRELKLKVGHFRIIPFIKPVLLVLIPLAALIALIYFGFLLSASKWDVQGIQGIVKIDDSATQEDGSLSIDAVIRTGDNSTAVVLIPSIGTIEVGPNTVLKRTNEELNCSLDIGQIKVTLNNKDKNFVVKLHGIEIREFADRNTYTLRSVEDDRFKLEVMDGCLEITSKHNRSIVPNNYYLYIAELIGVGLPCAQNASTDIKNLISEYTTQGNSQYIANVFISVAGKSEAISLWNLLPRLNPLNRGLIFEKLGELVGNPASVTKEGTINLDEKMMKIWLDRIRASQN